MKGKTALAMSLVFFSALFAFPVLADSETMNVSLIVPAPVVVPPVGALEGALLVSGQGLGGFLSAVNNPLASFLLLIGISIGILAIFYGFVHTMKKAFDTTVSLPELDNRKYSIFDDQQSSRKDREKR